MNCTIRYCLLLISFFALRQLPAQPANCVDFTSPEVGTTFSADTGVEPGEVVFQYPGIDLIMDTYLEANGNVTFGNININDFSIDGFAAPSAILNFANAVFQFDGAANNLCFTSWISGEIINFGLNGETILAEDLLDPTIAENWPDYQFSVEATGDGPGSLVYMCISGPLESFTIGGVEQIIDDVCIDYYPTCDFTNPVIETVCRTDGAIDLSIDFDDIIGNNEFVDVFLDGEFFAFYAIEAFPITLEGLFPNGGQDSTLVRVCINDNPNCCYDVVVELPNCCLNNLQVAQYACEDDELPYLFYLNFAHGQMAQDSFDLFVGGSGNVFGRYAYGDLPLSELEFGVEGGTELDLTVVDADNPDCFAETSIEVHFCAFACADFVATPGEVVCVETAAFSTQLLLSTPPAGQDIFLYSVTTGNLLDISPYNSWNGVYFIIDNSFDPLGYRVVDQLTGCETTFPAWEFDPEICLECALTNVSVTPTPCNDDNLYNIEIDLTSSNPVDPLYVIINNEQGFGPFYPEEFPVTLAGFSGGTDVVTVTIQSATENCLYTEEFVQNCNFDCEDFTAELTDVICISDSPYVALEITLDGVPDNSTSFYIQNQSTGTLLNVEFTGNPLVVSWPTADEGELLLFDLTNGCQSTIVYENTEDCTPDCSNVFGVLEVGCDDQGNPVFVFTADGPAGLPFFVRVGGPNSSEYAFVYGEETYSLTVDPTPGVFTYELRFRDQQAGCVSEVLVENPCFCFVEILAAEATECDANGQFNVLVAASGATSWGSGEFVLQVGNQTQSFGPGTVTYEFGPFDSGLVSVFLTEVNTELCQAQELVFQQCPTPECELFDLAIAGTECDADGNYFLEITFESNVNGPFSVYNVNTDDSVSVSLNDLPVVFGPYNIEEIEAHGIVVHGVDENNLPTCIIDESFVQECESAQCQINDLFIEGSECDANGNYFLDVTFNSNIDGPFTLLNEATGDVVVAGLNDLPVTFGPYNFSEIQTSLIIVTAEQNTGNGCLAEEIFVQECETEECNFSDIFAEAYECDGDQFLVDVQFDNPNGGPLGFYIFGDGMLFGPYQYGETFYTFGPLDGNETAHDILLLDIADPACFGTYDFSYSCSDDCVILEVIATPTECDGEFFNVELEVIGNNLGETFNVVGNGNNYGTFSYSDLPITLGPFLGDAETSYEFGVIDLQNAGCTNFTEIEPVNCQPCDIRDLVYEVDCNEDGYQLTLDFIFENQESDLFAVLIGGEVYEFFSYGELPLSIFVPYSFVGNTLRVEDILNEQCGETVDLIIPCCTLGNALDAITVNECEDDGTYSFTVGEIAGGNLTDSLVVNYSPAGSSIIATEVVAYNALPTTFGPLSGDGGTSYIVILSDQLNECAVTTTIEPVFCDNDACVEFEGVEGVFAPIFGYDTGDEITTENEVVITYQRNPLTNCACNLFVTDGIPGEDFGSGHIVATQNSGFGLDFTGVSTAFNTINLDYYYTGGTIGITVNEVTTISETDITDLPTAIAPGVELQVVPDPDNPSTGMLTFSGDNIEQLILFTNDNAGFDNVCLSLDDNVWPGDTNSDNIANHIDLLSIGLTFGNTGPARTAPTSEWTGLISQNWGDTFADGTNHKHADANGDGTVDLLDLGVLEQNYNLVHGPVTDFEPLPSTELDPPVFVDLPDQMPVGTVVEIPVIAGAADQVINDVYGLAFTLELDPEIFNMSSVAIVYPTSWFGEPGINTATIHEVYPDGRIEVALTRTDHNNVSGFGPIMALRIIIDDIAGLEVPTGVVVKNLLGIDHEEQPLVLRPGTSSTIVTKTETGFDRDLLRSSFGIFPNPTRSGVYFHNHYSMSPQRVDVFNAAGQHLRTVRQPGMQLDVSSLPAGVYMLQVHLEGHIFTERLVKLD